MNTVIVTGAASGIGAAVARALLDQGDNVIAVDVNEPGADLREADFIRVDLGSMDDIDSLVTDLEAHGKTPIHGLVHCAAISHVSLLADTPRETWQRVLRVNLEGSIALTQALTPHIAEGGRIVLFASGTVFKGPSHVSAYVASKAGIVGFARCMAEELGARDITVNVVAPGHTHTPMVAEIEHTEAANIATRALKRRAITDDIVGPTLFLLSPGARFVTGQTLCVDGGSVKR